MLFSIWKQLKIVRKELFIFCQRNKLLLALVIIALIFITKASDMQCFFSSKTICYIFLKPNQGTLQFEIMRLLENLSIAYLSSLIFYLIINYIPQRKNERKAFKIIESDLVNMYLDMSEIISIINFEFGITKELKDLEKKDLFEMDTIKIKKEIKYCNSKTIIDGDNKDRNIQCTCDYYVDLPKAVKSLLEKINNIKNRPCITNIEIKIIEILSEIESCKFVGQMSSFKIRFHGFRVAEIADKPGYGDDYFDFIQLYIKLNEYEFDKHSYVKTEMSGEEIEKYKAEQIEGKKAIEVYTESIRNKIKE